MSRTYKATGITLKSQPIGESDRLLTILTRELGLVQAVAMGARKHNSKMGGRSGLFVVNDLLIAQGRSLDKIAQADTLLSYPGLGQDLKKLTASQYLAELCLCQALSEQPQEDLFLLLNQHLQALEHSPTAEVMAHLTQAVFHMLAIAGVAPQVDACCMTRRAIAPNFIDSSWRVGFSIAAGGTVTLEVLERLNARNPRPNLRSSQPPNGGLSHAPPHVHDGPLPKARNQLLTADELSLLQQLAAQPWESVSLDETPPADQPPKGQSPEGRSPHVTSPVWFAVERLLRQYAQFHFDRPIRSAALIDACFLPTPFHSPEV
jgi:DNA repair protein RecO (recombination protein O)